MANLDCYNIIFKSLEIGNHTFEYELDNNFFKSLEDAEIEEGTLSAVVTVLKNEKNAELNIQIEGTVQIPCDRCLDEMTQEIEVDEDLLVQFTNAGEETENTLFIPENEGVLNIAWHLYEFIVLAIPIMHTHPDGECNEAMMDKYNQYVVRHIDEDQDDCETDDVTNESDRTDPRWDALKNISNNN